MSKTLFQTILLGLVCGGLSTLAADAPAKFFGAESCGSSGCHGGGGDKQNQFLTWSLKDFHSQRPAATLSTARSKQIAAAAGIADPTEDNHCTTCHAPLQDVPADLRGPGFKVSEGVSCESCHGPSENWIRAHTRHDYTRADRTAAGLRDLQNLYVRANTCVACHQVVSQPLLAAGHPELIFEMDGQSVTEPKHWSTEKNGNNAQAWLVGQAVALRELSWQLVQSHGNDLSARMAETNLVNRVSALMWVLRQATATTAIQQKFSEDFEAVQAWADQLAKDQAVVDWTPAMTHDCLTRLAGQSSSFTDPKIPTALQARRAERLVLALDRLVGAENNHKGEAELNHLFKLAQILPDFDPAAFAAALDKFAAAQSAP